MMTAAYDLVEVLVRTPRRVVSRAVRAADGLRVLLKEQTTPSSSGRHAGLQQEFELTQQLPLSSVAATRDCAVL